MLNQRKYAEMLSLGTIHSPVNSQWVQWVSKAAMLVHWAWSAKKTQVIILSEWSTLGWGQWPIPLSRPTGLGDYTHTPLIGICGTIFPSANGVHQTLWTESNFQPSDHIPVQHIGWESNPQPKTHNVRPRPLRQGICPQLVHWNPTHRLRQLVRVSWLPVSTVPFHSVRHRL